MLWYIVRKRILHRFYDIELTDFEKRMADEAVSQKYVPALRQAMAYSLLLTPALAFLDTEIVVSVLIPTTMVAGTAWFSVSLASMKKKFEDFGMELTTHLFVGFSLSLSMLFLATAASLTAPLWTPRLPAVADAPGVQLSSALLAMCVVGKLLFAIFAGSLKYDINDAMLTGQNEAAERFFKQSLSLLYTTAQQLRQGMPLQVANYSLGVAFYEVFNNIRDLQPRALKNLDALLSDAERLIDRPAMRQAEADGIVFDLIDAFSAACSNRAEVHQHRSYKAIIVELGCLRRNAPIADGAPEKEDQGMVDTRMAIVFSEMSNLIEEFGPSLFDSSDRAK